MRFTKERLLPLAAAAFALGLIAGAALASHSWDEHAGVNPIYAILALLVVALAFPSTRQWVREATNVKLPGGFEITRQVEDAVAEAATLPDADESFEWSSKRKLKILGKDWSGDPKSAIGLLQGELREKLYWIEREFYDGKRRADSETLGKLRADGLIGLGQARLLRSLSEATGVAMEREFAKGGKTKETAVRFMEEADRTVSRVRLVVLDSKIRMELREEGLRVMDIGEQPSSRWPDFYAFDSETGNAPPLRIAPRVALQKGSSLVKEVWDRLEATEETPLDAEAQRVIVIPQRSRTMLDTNAEVTAFRRNDFMNWIAARRAAFQADESAG